MSKIVLCEGPFDEAVLRRLAKVHDLDIEIVAYNGKDNLKRYMKAFKDTPDIVTKEVETLVVTRDADDSQERAFRSVHDTLKNFGFLPPSENETFAEGTPKVGIFIVGLEGRGAIEDLCLASVRDCPEFPCVEKYFACTGRDKPNSKLHAWAWLVSYPDFECCAISAAQGKTGTDYWNLEHAAFEPLKKFLKEM